VSGPCDADPSSPGCRLVVDGEPVAPREWLDDGGDVASVVELARGLHGLP
jgi:hypothetical protein